MLDSWRWTENLSETCRVLSQKYIWESSASRCFYYKNISRCTVLQMSNFVTKLPNDGSYEPKQAAQCCIALKCRVWLHTAFVFKYSLTQRDITEQNWAVYCDSYVHELGQHPRLSKPSSVSAVGNTAALFSLVPSIMTGLKVAKAENERFNVVMEATYGFVMTTWKINSPGSAAAFVLSTQGRPSRPLSLLRGGNKKVASVGSDVSQIFSPARMGLDAKNSRGRCTARQNSR